ncbi:MAG: polysaccharide deacetylase family protein [Oscillospiraceae bacterium]|nr:polysaccharide deacetylase family protein [Oscillospiraceae bacterium]
MFVYTISKRRAVRMLLLVLALIAGIIIGIAAILTAISTGAAERKLPIYHVERADNKVALTFNCAWGNSNTNELLAILEKENVKATFFVTGEFCDKYPEDVLKIFKAGHEIQSHSNRHPHVEGANINELIIDTREAEEKIRAITGVTPTLYRAPYGEYDNNSIFAINGMGYKYIQWSVDSIDWKEPDANTIVKRIVSGTKSGSILLFHNDLENTTEALPTVISRLKEKGFDFASVSDLIYWENYQIDSSGRQVQSNTSASIDAAIHMPGTGVNSAFELLLENLTIEEIMSLENGLSPELALKLSNILSKDEISAITALSDDELQSAWGLLVEAKATGQIGQLSANAEQTSATTAMGEIKGANANEVAGISAGNSAAASTTAPLSSTAAEPAITTGTQNAADTTNTWESGNASDTIDAQEALNQLPPKS